jgi:hypothetical protein
MHFALASGQTAPEQKQLLHTEADIKRGVEAGSETLAIKMQLAAKQAADKAPGAGLAAEMGSHWRKKDVRKAALAKEAWELPQCFREC